MKSKIRNHSKLDKISQTTLGIIFLVSAILKIIDFPFFVESLQPIYFLPVDAAVVAAISVILSELILGFLISTNILSKQSILLAIVLLSIFVLIGFYSVITSKNWICACFGSIFSGTFSYSTIIRDIFLLALAIFVYHRYSLTKFKDRNINQLGVAVSILCSLTLLFSFFLKQQKSPSQLIIGNKIEDFQAQSLNGKFIDTYAKGEFSYILFILFDIERDCLSCLTEFPLWNKIHNDFFSDVRMIGVAYAKDKEFLDKWISVRNLKFPIILDEDKQIMNLFNNVGTPTKILINQENQIIGFQKSSSNEKEQNKFYNLIEQKLKEYSSSDKYINYYY